MILQVVNYKGDVMFSSTDVSAAYRFFDEFRGSDNWASIRRIEDSETGTT